MNIHTNNWAKDTGEDFEEIWEIVNNMAKVKLMMNSHKGPITELEPTCLIRQAHTELVELEEALTAKGDNYMNVIEEAADVLNYMTAAVHNAVHKYRNRRKDENPGHVESYVHTPVVNSKHIPDADSS